MFLSSQLKNLITMTTLEKNRAVHDGVKQPHKQTEIHRMLIAFVDHHYCGAEAIHSAQLFLT